MAKKTDLLTGKEEEVSADEVMEAMKGGNGFIKQSVTLPDGTKKEMAIWGGYELDGYDRTLNVFMKHSDIGTFAKLLTEGELDTDDIEDPCTIEEGYQVTVDFTDISALSIMRKGQGKLSLEMYVRDEKKSCRNPIESGTGEIGLEEDGSLSLNEEKLKKNKFLLYGLSFLGLRKYLLKKGIVQKLYAMFDESSGVLVKVSKSGTITTKIVKGMDRPDLPCDVFLFGEQICRPYIDEMLGLESSGVRKPRDPELVAKLAEADRVAKENAKEKRKKEAEEQNKKDLANKRRKLTQTNNKLAELTDQKTAIEQELEGEAPKEAEYKERCSAAEAECAEKKRGIQNRISELEANQKSLDSVRSQEVSTYSDAQRKNRSEKEELIKELKKAQAVFEVKQEVADIYKDKAEKGGGKKKTARYTEKREEAKASKQVVDDIVAKIDDIEGRQKEEDARHKNNEDSYVAQKQQIESELSQKRSSLNEVNSVYEKEKSECDAYVQTLDAKRNELKDVTKQIGSIKKEIKLLEQEIEALEKA